MNISIHLSSLLLCCLHLSKKQIDMHLCPAQSIPIPFSETNSLRFCQLKQRNQSNKVADIFIAWIEVLKWASGMGLDAQISLNFSGNQKSSFLGLWKSVTFFSSANTRLYKAVVIEEKYEWFLLL